MSKTDGSVQFLIPCTRTMFRTVSTCFANFNSTRPDLLAVVKVLVLELATAGHHSPIVVKIAVWFPLSTMTIQRIPARTSS
eukprot:07902_4